MNLIGYINKTQKIAASVKKKEDEDLNQFFWDGQKIMGVKLGKINYSADHSSQFIEVYITGKSDNVTSTDQFYIKFSKDEEKRWKSKFTYGTDAKSAKKLFQPSSSKWQKIKKKLSYAFGGFEESLNHDHRLEEQLVEKLKPIIQEMMRGNHG